ncbi:hypothetical protein K438DRAFT_1772651 [Mycena galopus ATCC 62051]|nr:hypothetical protein K438DRAFT_1772651 [Mycena galopus ATCC 62051]
MCNIKVIYTLFFFSSHDQLELLRSQLQMARQRKTIQNMLGIPHGEPNRKDRVEDTSPTIKCPENGSFNRELAQKPHEPRTAFWHCAKPQKSLQECLQEKKHAKHPLHLVPDPIIWPTKFGALIDVPEIKLPILNHQKYSGFHDEIQE